MLEFSGDGGPAIKAGLNGPSSATIDAAGNIYIADVINHRIRRVDARTGIITTVAGNGKRNSGGDGGPALDAGIEFPHSVAVDRDGNFFITQAGYGQDSHRIRRVDAKTGFITTASASLQFPADLLCDRMGNLYVIDNGRVQYIELKTQTIRTVVGSLKVSAIAMDSEDNLYVAADQRVHRVDARTGVIQTVAGNGLPPARKYLSQ